MVNELKGEDTLKYFFQTISSNAYFTIVSLCKLPRNVHDIYFLRHFMKYINSENRFSIFSIMKTIEFVSMLG